MIKNVDSTFRPEYHWFGRNLESYISMHPKARGAKTLTQARQMAFGFKKKNYGCKCRQPSCRRVNGGGSNC